MTDDRIADLRRRLIEAGYTEQQLDDMVSRDQETRATLRRAGFTDAQVGAMLGDGDDLDDDLEDDDDDGEN